MSTVPRPASAAIGRGTLYRQYSRGSSGSGSSTENLPPRTLSRVAREVRDLYQSPPEGVRLVVDDDSGMPSNLGELVAEIEGPQGTPYEARFFQLKLVLGGDFPSSPPRGFFLTKIYHPNVDMSTGAICVNTLKKDWNPQTTFAHVLSVIRCLMIVPFPESSLNDEAGKLFMESYDEYSKRARLLADVHGRPKPASVTSVNAAVGKVESNKPLESYVNGNGNGNGNVTRPEDDPSRPRDQDKPSNPLADKNSNHVKSTAASKGGSSRRMTKKKSLKRL